MVQMVREGSSDGKPPNSTDFMAEFGISRRTVARDLDFLRDEERAPLEYDDARHGYPRFIPGFDRVCLIDGFATTGTVPVASGPD